MAAADNLNPHQLAMFVPAKEIVEKWGLADQMLGQSRASVWKTKIKESKIGGVSSTHGARATPQDPSTHYESIRAEGIKNPVEGHQHTNVGEGLRPGLLGQGHHRVAAAYDIDPDTEVPVKWMT